MDLFRCFFKLTVLLILPFLSYFILKRNRDKISTEEFDLKFGTLYLNMNTSKPAVLTFTSFFCLKRLFISLGTVFLNESVILNLYINIFVTLWFIKYLIDNQPMNFKYLNQLEIINEVIMLFFTYFIFLFTDFVNDIKVRYKLGFWFIYMVGFIFLVNLSLISVSIFNDTVLEKKRQKAKEEWEKFEKLKRKMALFLVMEAGKKEKRIYDNQRALGKRKSNEEKTDEILQKYTYKQMEKKIINIFEGNSKKTSKTSQIMNVLSSFFNEVSQPVVTALATPRFGAQNTSAQNY